MHRYYALEQKLFLYLKVYMQLTGISAYFFFFCFLKNIFLSLQSNKDRFDSQILHAKLLIFSFSDTGYIKRNSAISKGNYFCICIFGSAIKRQILAFIVDEIQKIRRWRSIGAGTIFTHSLSCRACIMKSMQISVQ